ncbi:MAG: DUF5011 domain-containing protein [Eubacteriaceae bacterium]|nr:DUF5011 domain-containing protein [Eubacteriaceae bacterium]
MKCNFCKNEIESNMRFCPYCGQPIAHSTPLDKYMDDEQAASNKPADKFDDIFKAHERSKSEERSQINKQTNEHLRSDEIRRSSRNADDFYMPKIFNPDSVDEVSSDDNMYSANKSNNAKQNLSSDTPDKLFNGETEVIKTRGRFSGSLDDDIDDDRPLYTISDTNRYEKDLDYDNSYYVRRPRRNNRKILIIAGAVVLALILAALAYFFIIGSKPHLKQKTTSIEAGTQVDLLSLVEIENSSKYDVQVKSGQIDNMVPGQYNVTYTVTNKKNDKTEDFAFMFNVVDTTPPTITAPDSITVFKNTQFDILQNVSVTDTVDGTINNANITITGNIDSTTKGTYPVTLTVSDKAGNKATKAINVIIDDPTAFFNSITGVWKFDNVEGQQLIIKKDGSKYKMYVGFEGSEGYGGEFTFKTVSSDSKTATLTWYVQDEEGTVTQEVKIDTGAPGDKKMKVDIGQGWQNLTYLKKN